MEEGHIGKKPLKRHKEPFHSGQDVEVGCKVLSQYYGKPTRRMIHEAVLIVEL